MTQEEIEKAFTLLSMHNSELLLQVAELERRLARQSLWFRIKLFFRKPY
jgi:hypothetical protein